MASLIYLDTHLVVWLYAGRLEELTSRAKAAVEQSDLLISPMVVLELQYLHEIGRLTVPAETIVGALAAEIGLQICDQPFPRIVAAAVGESWTRDPFDRIIVAQARMRDVALISKDVHIQSHYPRAWWFEERS